MDYGARRDQALAHQHLAEIGAKPVRIETIHYERIRNLGNYENVKANATASLEPGDDPDEKYEELRIWVLNQLRKEGHSTS